MSEPFVETGARFQHVVEHFTTPLRASCDSQHQDVMHVALQAALLGGCLCPDLLDFGVIDAHQVMIAPPASK